MMYVLVLIMTMVGAFGAYFLKLASAVESVFGLLKAPAFYVGAGLYGLSAVLNIILLRVLPYSIVLPLTSLTYVWTAIVGWRLLKERISLRMLCGIACIVVGVAVLMTA